MGQSNSWAEFAGLDWDAAARTMRQALIVDDNSAATTEFETALASDLVARSHTSSEHHHIGGLDVRGGHQPVGQECPGQTLRIVVVHLAPKRLQKKCPLLCSARHLREAFLFLNMVLLLAALAGFVTLLALSLVIGILPVILAFVIGTSLGLVAGYVGGKLNTAIMRTIDVFYAFPSVLLAIAISGALGAGIVNSIVSLTIVFVPQITRVAESVTTGVRNMDFVEAARALGAYYTPAVLAEPPRLGSGNVGWNRNRPQALNMRVANCCLLRFDHRLVLNGEGIVD